MMLQVRPLAVLAVLVIVLIPFTAHSSDPDSTPNSAFYEQQGRADGSGYYVRDGVDGRGNPMLFYSEYRRLGGVDTLGYPISRPFLGAGDFSYQVFQRAALQWRAELGRAVLANTFEWLHQAGRDAWLSDLGVPPSSPDDGSNGDWNKARVTRLSWLTQPAIQAKFLANPDSGPWTEDDAIQRYGLPMSLPERRGPFVVQRFQRIALQLWVDNVPGMPAPGSVVAVLGGEMMKQSGLIPAEALAPDLKGSPAKPAAMNGLYLSSVAAARDNFRQRVFDLARTTEINAVVVDVKNEFGYSTYASDVPLAKQIGADTKPTVADFAALLAMFRQRGLYVIARIPVFKDDLLARARPDLAIVDRRTGQPWRDAKGLAWTDPYREEVWNYNIALAKEAVTRGVDEIQFDFIRFPGDPATDGPGPDADNPQRRRGAIEGLLARASAQLRPLGGKLAADLFGFTIWTKQPLAVGQDFDGMAQYLDVVSPMLYPSSFTSGIPGYRRGVDNPYEIVLHSVQQAKARLGNRPVLVRPWLQDFADYAVDGRPFALKEVAAQIRGAKDGGASGFMLWNPSITYTAEALAPR